MFVIIGKHVVIGASCAEHMQNEGSPTGHKQLVTFLN